MKKILSLILALLMIVSCASFIFAEEAAVTAEAPANEEAADVIAPAPAANDETASKYYDAVKFLVSYDIMHGKGDKLGVYDNIKRYEMALFIGRICTGWVADDQWEDGPENSSNFIDLAGTAAENYYGAISFVNEKGIVVGVGGNKFAPEAGIKYEDALTMAVRALGYKDLAYPWGYIEKAVNLGLTAGIEGVAYSETLKREVVAQIIYNALFAKGADGETLAKKNFNLDLNYEVVMITACDGGVYTANGEKTPAGYVAYQIFNADGTLGGQTYLTTAESFGLKGEHDDEKALGGLFKAVFNKNTEYGLGQILSVESLEMEAVLNEGLNSKSAGKYPIQAFLDDYKIVSKYSAKTAFNADVNEIIIATAGVEATVTLTDLVAVDWLTGDILVKDDAGVYQIAWYYNELLDTYFRYKKEVKDNGDIILAGIEFMSAADAADIYGNVGTTKTITAANCYAPMTFVGNQKIPATAYAALRIFDADGDGVADYGMYAAYRLGKFTTTAPVLDTSKLVVGDSYATIVANRTSWFGSASDEEFWNDIAFPKFTAASEVYSNIGLEIYDYSEVPNGGVPARTLPLVNNSTVDVEGCRPGFVSFQNGGATMNGKIVKLGLTVDDVWFTEGEAPADGTWVIYGANPVTNEVTIVKALGEYEEGSDTYIATGVLRAYSTAKKTVTIGNETFSTSYDELTGSTFTSKNYRDGVWYKGSQYLADLFNQFVTYIVVDGKVVYVEACGDEDYRFLVVESFAGISSDGYIVINAWDTTDGKCKQIRIASLDGWKFGDIFYYADNYAEAYKLFEQDTVLQILSYNPETNAYGVTELKGLKQGTSEEDGLNAQSYSASGKNFVWFTMNFTYAKVGIRCSRYLGKYRADPADWTTLPNGAGSGNGDNNWTIKSSTNGLTKNMSEDDTYVFIFAPGQIAGSPIRIWKGQVTDSSWYCKGWRLCGTDGKTHIFMGVLADNVNGFDINKAGTNHTLVMLPDYKNPNDLGSWYLPELGKQINGWQIAWGNGSAYFENADQHPWGYVISAAYDELVPHEDWYLLGNTEYDVMVLNLRTLHSEIVKASDRNMKANYIYEVIDGKVVGEPHKASDLYQLLIGTFGHTDMDLDNDLVELFTTSYNTADKKASHESGSQAWIHEEYSVLNINRWLSKKWAGIETVDFGSYTIARDWKNLGAVAIYEAADGHCELIPLGGGNKASYDITYNGAYGEYPVRTNNNKMNPSVKVQYWLSGSNSDLDVATVTIVNMDNVKLGKNLDPYGAGLAAVTYLFNASKVTVDHTFDK